MILTLNIKSLEKTINNIIKYSNGFIDGAKRGTPKFLENLGVSTIQAMYQYIDLEARANPASLHHVYEWYRVGSPSARLYNLSYSVSGSVLSINSSFKQSTSVSNGSSTPFYNKAAIMESGIPVSIKPKKNFLVFNVDGETVFTSKEVSVQDPGGRAVQGSYQRIFDQFMTRYFSQSFLRASGIFDYVSKPYIYKKMAGLGAKQGRSAGINAGYQWMSNAKAGVE